MKKLMFSGSPHVKDKISTKRIMTEVFIALLPATIVGILFFGYNALITVVVAIAAAVLGELAFQFCMKKSLKQFTAEFDCTSAVTGLLIGMNMPPMVNWYIPVLASLFAVIVVKLMFGGTGKNLVNPALAGRVFVVLSFGIVAGGGFVLPNINYFTDPSIISGATPLTELLNPESYGAISATNIELFLGNISGTIGETSAAALLAGGVYLCARKIIDFRFPLIYIAVTGFVFVVLKGFNLSYFLPCILSGGLFLGAIFMATDYTTTPDTQLGNYIYFTLLGILTAVLRLYCKTEVVSFAILFMNLTVPLFDKYIVPRPFGWQKPVKKTEADA